MNCQPESENNHNNAAVCAEQQPMEVLDYLRLASFIRYQAPDAQPVESGRTPDDTDAALYA